MISGRRVLLLAVLQLLAPATPTFAQGKLKNLTVSSTDSYLVTIPKICGPYIARVFSKPS